MVLRDPVFFLLVYKCKLINNYITLIITLINYINTLIENVIKNAINCNCILPLLEMTVGEIFLKCRKFFHF